MTRRLRMPRVVPVLAVLTLALAGCGDGDGPDTGPTTVPPPTMPTSTPTPTPTAPPSPTATSTPTGTPTEASPGTVLHYYLVREAPDGLWVEPVAFDAGDVGQAVARAAFTELLDAPDRAGLVNLVPEGTELLDVAVADRVLTVDLSSAVMENPTGAAGEEAFQQVLAHTGAQFPTVDRVAVRVDGEEVETLWGHLDWSTPLEPDPLAIAPIVVTQAVGAPGRIELAGTSNTFEATVEIDVAADDGGAEGGDIVRETFTTATCGTGCRGEWSTTIEDLDAGSYTVTLREPDPSGGEGPPPFEVSVDVTVP